MLHITHVAGIASALSAVSAGATHDLTTLSVGMPTCSSQDSVGWRFIGHLHSASSVHQRPIMWSLSQRVCFDVPAGQRVQAGRRVPAARQAAQHGAEPHPGQVRSFGRHAASHKLLRSGCQHRLDSAGSTCCRQFLSTASLTFHVVLPEHGVRRPMPKHCRRDLSSPCPGSTCRYGRKHLRRSATGRVEV